MTFSKQIVILILGKFRLTNIFEHFSSIRLINVQIQMISIVFRCCAVLRIVRLVQGCIHIKNRQIIKHRHFLITYYILLP